MATCPSWTVGPEPLARIVLVRPFAIKVVDVEDEGDAVEKRCDGVEER